MEDYKPDFTFVHGDTTTSMAASLASFYFGSKVCHVEAGLRTYDKSSPFPEEINRQLTSRISDYHFAPTEESKNNLLNEKINPYNIVVTGNTVIDALLQSVKKLNNYKSEIKSQLEDKTKKFENIILVTAHRRKTWRWIQ